MRRACVIAVVLFGLALAPATAGAAFVDPASAGIELLDAAGEPETRAGAHPDRLITRFSFTKGPSGHPGENVKDIYLDLPKGFSGNPLAVPYCPRGKILNGNCPGESQVGIAYMNFELLGETELPIYNIEPAGDEIAEVAFSALILVGRFQITLRAEDGGLRMEARDFPQEIPILASEIELWGVPVDHQGTPAPQRRAFLSMPTSCGATPAAVLGVRTWQKPAAWELTPLPLPALGGCSELPFSPALEVTPGEFEADSPTGLEFTLRVPQSEDPDALVSDQPRSMSVSLPRGFSLSPSVADGLLACSDAQVAVGLDVPAACPAASRIGSVELQSPVLPGALEGRVYIGPASLGGPFRAFVVIERPGLRVKLPVVLRADGAGGLTAELTEMPQLPVSRLSIIFDPGPRAALASPQSCGVGAVQATLGRYGGGASAVSARVLTSKRPGGVPCGRGRPFAPTLLAGSTSPVAGRSTGFSVTLRRGDGEQALAGMRIEMPLGMVAGIRGVPRCQETEIAAAACPPAGKVGSTVVEAGPGPAPLAIEGDVYLTGPYRGAPFGLAMLVPVSVGPFQLGTATIRAALSIDAESGRLSVATDPLPQVVEGIPLRIRTVGIDIDLPGFMRNPTSCQAAEVNAEVVSAEGGTARTTTRGFQLRGCDRLRFDPKLSLALLDASSGRPGLRIGVRPRGKAAIRSLDLRLPGVLAGNPDSLAVPCPRERYRRGSCPPASLLGSAQARTPLLAARLAGPVHLVQATTVGPPQLWTELRGGGVRLVTKTVTTISAGGLLVTRVKDLPDFPLSSLTTTLRSGPRSLFRTARPLCKGARPLAEMKARAHSGARASRVVPVRVEDFACGG